MIRAQPGMQHQRLNIPPDPQRPWWKKGVTTSYLEEY